MATPASSEIIESVLLGHSPDDRWRKLVSGLAGLGLDQINYAFLDLASHERVKARAEPFLANMRADWIDHYVERKYDLVDDLVDHVKHGGFTPRLYDFHHAEHFSAPIYAHEAREAGLNTGLVIPLSGDPVTFSVTAGIMFGSSLTPKETTKILSDNAPALTALAHVFHTGMVGEFRRVQAGARPLTPRERDCLQLAARGMRTTAIAYRLRLSESTVTLHFSNARRKLHAKSLTETVARALHYQQIVLE